MTTKTKEMVNLQQFTKLPLRIVEVGNKQFPDIMVGTPHKGVVIVALKTEHHPFFGSVTQTENHFDTVYSQIKQLEIESAEYLINKWKETLQED